MSLNTNRINAVSLSRQRGSMLIIAVVVMTVVLLLGLAMTRVLASSSNSVVYEVLGSRALNAARSGLEVNLTRVLNEIPVNGSLRPPLNICNMDGNFSSDSSFSNVPGFENCRYDNRCNARPVNDNGTTILYFRFSSTGICTVDGATSVSRNVSVDARL